MTQDAPHLAAAAAGSAIDLRQFDATLETLRRYERALGAAAVNLAEARDGLAASPDDAEARHRVRMAQLHFRGEAVAVAAQLAALAQEGLP